MLAEFRSVVAGLDLGVPRIPIVSNVTGGLLTDEQAMSPDYWVSHVREPVRFMDGVRAIEAEGVTRWLELGPDGVLAAMAGGCRSDVESADGGELFTSALRKDRDEQETLLTALAELEVAGGEVDWAALYDGTAARRVALPTYAFQRQRYWLEPASGVADLAAAGQSSAEHPLLGAAIAVAGEDRWLFTGRLSLDSHGWLADHAIFDTVLLPGTALAELALRAGGEVGCDVVEELTLELPLVLSEQGAVQLQIAVGQPDDDGRREIAIHSRHEDDAADDESGAADRWTRHASGRLAPVHAVVDDRLERFAAAAWPPEGADPLDVDGLYDRIAALGFGYGPVFQGLQAVWRRDDEIYAEVALDPATDVAGYGIHPALLDAALHTAFLADARDELRLPFAWSGLRLARAGAAALRVRIGVGESGLRIDALDDTGRPVAVVEGLDVRTVDAAQLRSAARGDDPLFSIVWGAAEMGEPRPIATVTLGELDVGFDGERHADLAALTAALEAGASTPDLVLAAIRVPADAGGAAARAATAEVLTLLQTWLADERFAAARLALICEGAVAARDDEAPDPVAAAVAGLVRSAQAEHPGQISLVDVDRSDASRKALAAALASEEPQLALREGVAWAPRMERARVAADADAPAWPADPDSTVLITGGTGGLGALVARHLVERHGARRLLLASRSGAAAGGAGELREELERLGAHVTVAGCDVADREQVGALIDSIPDEHPLGAVIHAAGVLDDGVVELLTGERIDAVMAPKADAAWHLHELTRDLDLSAFVLFSSVAGPLGGAGQGNYAAANAFLDALAQARRAEGLAASSLAWGAWSGAGMAGELDEQDRARLRRMGILALAPEEGLDLFDAALALEEPLLVVAGFDFAALRPLARAGMLPSVFSRLVRVPARRMTEAPGSFARRLAALPEEQWDAAVAELVGGHVAAVLGHSSADAFDAELAFKDLGFDSLASVELRNRLSQATGLRLPATLVFDHPTPAAVAAFLRERLATGAGAPAPIDEQLDRLESLLAAVADGADEAERERIDGRLRGLAARLADGRSEDDGGRAAVERIQSASADEIFELIDRQFGTETDEEHAHD